VRIIDVAEAACSSNSTYEIVGGGHASAHSLRAASAGALRWSIDAAGSVLVSLCTCYLGRLFGRRLKQGGESASDMETDRRRLLLFGAAASTGAAARADSAGYPVRHNRVRAEDGYLLSVRIYGAGRRAVLLIPGGHGVGEAWHLQAVALAQAGHLVVALDYRGRGRSEPAVSDDERLPADVAAVCRWLRAEVGSSIDVVAASLGGWGLARVLAEQPGIVRKAVFLAPPGLEQLQSLTADKLFVVAELDRNGAGKLRVDLTRAELEEMPEPKRLLVVPGAAHAQFLFLTEGREAVLAAILRFLAE
jgi:dienelactone hydrolase